VLVPTTVTGWDSDLEHVLDLIGVFVFAVSGALLAVRKGYDVVGLVALASVTALGGGVLRDLMIGVTPPLAIDAPRYLIVPLVAAGLVFLFHGSVERRLSRPVLIFDAAGLGLFCVTGSAKALGAGVNSVGAVALGVLTATGGGVMRDVLAGESPVVFRPDSVLYAIPAAVGAALVAAAWELDVYGPWSAATIAIGVFALRVAALHFGWLAPRPRHEQPVDR
jgi:uncharacterized membrane protein YeiH